MIIRASKRRRLLLLLSVGWVPPDVHPSGACLSRGTSILIPASSRRRGLHRTGAASFPMHVGTLLRSGLMSTLRCPGTLLGHGPHETCPFTGHGPSDHVMVFPSCHKSSGAFVESELGCPPAVLDDCGLFVPPQWQMATDFGRIAGRPGACAESSSGRGIAGFGHGPRTSSVTRRVCRRDPAQTFHQCSWLIKARESAHFG